MHCPYCGKENEGDNQFCMFCGQPMPGYEGEAPLPVGGYPQPPTPPKKKIPILQISAIIGAALLIIAVIAVVISSISRITGGDQYIYAIQESSASEPFSAIMLTKGDGKSDIELAQDRDGYFPSTRYLGLPQNVFSPTGKQFVLREKDAAGDLLLFSDDGSIPVYLSDSSLPGLHQGFSPDGKYFAYTDIDQANSEFTVHIVDDSGNLVLSVERAMFGAFLPDSKKLVVLEIDREHELFYSGLVLIDIARGDLTFLVSLDLEDLDSYQMIYLPPFVSPDGKQVYYFWGTDLMSVPITGGTARTVRRFDSENSRAFFAPDKKNLVLLDVISGSREADLILHDPQSNQRVRVEKDVYIGDTMRSVYGEENIKFSPNNKYVAYLVYNNAKYDLYISNIESRQSTRLVSGSSWISFDFSPDNKRIAYIDGRSSTKGGSLFIIEFDGSDRKRLETDVWSFQFDSRGRNIYYFTVDDISRRRPEAEMFRIRIDGTKKDNIMPAEYGIMTFLKYSQ
jgi:Tol biopolymer transport system component